MDGEVVDDVVDRIERYPPTAPVQSQILEKQRRWSKSNQNGNDSGQRRRIEGAFFLVKVLRYDVDVARNKYPAAHHHRHDLAINNLR